MDALQAIYTRRSTRNYKPDPVEEEKLEQLLEAARQAPSGSNSQNNHFLVIRNPEVIRKLISMTETAFAKMEADELKGSMHRAEDVRTITQDMLYAVRNGLMALPGRLAVDVVACETAAEAYEVVKREVHALMREFADYKYDPDRYAEAVRERMEWSAEGLIDDE